ncbi:MAG: class I SAM-dependent methyltransferase [Fidelibacterota bacterium]|nr:MAG: class I SAM-dependent methyltransferase [Candidatus Neomarinimicrobiota bacterium]
MTEEQQWDIARALETTPELLPYIPELLADLWELGSSPSIIVDWVRTLGLERVTTQVLDLGCGKGAVSILIARELRFRVYGIDLFKPFIMEARQRAEEHGVSDRCQFEVADIRNIIMKVKNFDIVVYTAVGGLLGRWDEGIGQLRQTVRPGGYIVIDDGFLLDPAAQHRPGYEYISSHDETIELLTSCGDRLLREKVYPSAETAAINGRYLDCIRKRAEELRLRHPEAEALLLEYIEQQERENDFLETMVAGAMWLIQRR